MILEVPEDTRKAFKIKCWTNDTNMKDAIVEFMKEYLSIHDIEIKDNR